MVGHDKLERSKGEQPQRGDSEQNPAERLGLKRIVVVIGLLVGSMKVDRADGRVDPVSQLQFAIFKLQERMRYFISVRGDTNRGR